MHAQRATFYEFFAGGGMARAAMGRDWACVFANDISEKKARSYVENWGDEHFCLNDVESLSAGDLPGVADLAWASFPCQDLSLAGAGAGLRGKRSGVFWGFWRLIEELASDNRAPTLIVLENVVGILTSHGGRDFQRVCNVLAVAGYRVGALVVDAVHFVPQSRPRVFFIAVRIQVPLPLRLFGDGPPGFWSGTALERAAENLRAEAQENWVWWNLPPPLRYRDSLSDIIEESPNTVAWDEPAVTKRLLSLMSPVNLAKVREAQKTGRHCVGTLYRRTRIQDGERIQRAEVRFDEIAGCLRTPAGGSSRQRLLIVDGKSLRSRLISSRELARLMGLPNNYVLPENYNEAYHLTGDGVVVPAVAHIRKFLLDPIVRATRATRSKAA